MLKGLNSFLIIFDFFPLESTYSISTWGRPSKFSFALVLRRMWWSGLLSSYYGLALPSNGLFVSDLSTFTVLYWSLDASLLMSAILIRFDFLDFLVILVIWGLFLPVNWAVVTNWIWSFLSSCVCVAPFLKGIWWICCCVLCEQDAPPDESTC